MKGGSAGIAVLRIAERAVSKVPKADAQVHGWMSAPKRSLPALAKALTVWRRPLAVGRERPLPYADPLRLRTQ